MENNSQVVKQVEKTGLEVFSEMENASSPIKLVSSLIFHIIETYKLCYDNFSEEAKLKLFCERSTIGDMLLIAVNQLNEVSENLDKIEIYKSVEIKPIKGN